jgi:hypothetical protein
VLEVYGGVLLCDAFAWKGFVLRYGSGAYDIQVLPVIHLADFKSTS